MEELIDQQETGSSHQLSSTAVDHMKRSSKWMKFLAITGFVFTAFIIFAALGMAGAASGIGSGFMIVYLLFALISLFMNLFLFQCANYFKKFADGADRSDGDNAFIKLNTLSTFAGVITIIYIAFVIIIIATGSLGALLLGGVDL
jgi:hypothetical protein